MEKEQQILIVQVVVAVAAAEKEQSLLEKSAEVCYQWAILIYIFCKHGSIVRVDHTQN